MIQPLLIARNERVDLALLPALANRHGLITGATDSGKTVTLQTLAHAFSSIGVPVFMADVKGDLSGIAKAGGSNSRVAERSKSLKLDLKFESCPTVFWDVFGEKGRPGMVERAFIVPPGSQLGPLDPAERKKAIESAGIYGHYEKSVERESAYEKLKGRALERHAGPAANVPAGTPGPQRPQSGGRVLSDLLFGRTGPRGGQQSKGMLEAMAGSASRAIGSELGRQVLRGVLGSIFGGKRK